jgi:23S rRNA (uracil1939-C5)-methyltransferase
VETSEPQDVDATFALGLHVPGRFDKVLDLTGCAIHFEGADALLATARELALEMHLAPWDTRAHEGLLRHLVLRKGIRTGEIMVNLVTSRDAPDEIGPYAEAFVARHPEITTFVQNVNTLAASVAVGQWEHVLHGPGVIHEKLGGLRFTISAATFFQTNTLQAERLVEVVREEARAADASTGGGTVAFDLYCGSGSLGMSIAGEVRELWGFESVPQAVRDARQNALQNNLENTHFVEGDVLAILEDPERKLPQPDLCLVDPPRAGLHPKVLPALVQLGPRRIIYVSCNVKAAARDLPYLAIGGYSLRRVRPIDLFPHTPHVECVFTLEREG